MHGNPEKAVSVTLVSEGNVLKWVKGGKRWSIPSVYAHVDQNRVVVLVSFLL